MNSLFAKKAWLPGGWTSDVRLTIDASGSISNVETGAAALVGDTRLDILLPGMPNVHSHAFQRATAGLAEHASKGSNSFWTWRNLMYELANKLPPEGLEAIASQLYMELIKSGYTSVAEFHYVHQNDGASDTSVMDMSAAVLSAASQSGIGLTHLPVVYEVSGFGAAQPSAEQAGFCHSGEGYVRLLEELAPILRTAPDADLGIAFHSLRAVRPETMAEILAWSDKNLADSPIHIHIAEQEAEVRDCLAHHGARPVEWLLENVDVNHRWCLVHATHMSAAECEKAAETGAIAGLCPTTEANLGDGFFDLTPWLSANGAVGIGSDSNVCTSPVEELRLLEYGARLRERRRLVSTSPEAPGTGAFLWSKATKAGARALGRPCGAIETGMKADLLGLDENHPVFAAASDETLIDCLVFGPSNGAIHDVFVGGNHVIKDGAHDQEQEISASYVETVKKLLA